MIVANQNFTEAQSSLLRSMVFAPSQWRCPLVSDEDLTDDLAWLAERGYIVASDWDWLPTRLGARLVWSVD